MLEGANDYSILTFVAIGTALFFDFVNGFHDSANAIATVVGTRVLKPLHAVIIADHLQTLLDHSYLEQQ